MADFQKTAYEQGVNAAAEIFGVKISAVKIAGGLVDDIPGYFVGKHFGKKQRERGEEYSFGGKQLASMLLPGGVGYQLGRAVDHDNAERAKLKPAKKPEAGKKE